MQRHVLATSPGKLILMGEHAAVYGRPALVAAVAPRTRIEVTANSEGIFVDLPDLDRELWTGWTELRQEAIDTRTRWQAYSESPTAESFQTLRNPDPVHLVRLALGELAVEMGTDLPPIAVRVKSDLPIGSGFGSSAAVGVGLVGGILCFLEGEVDRERVDRIALEVERRQHGMPSGVDHRTVLHGGILWAERSFTGELRTVPVGGGQVLGSRIQVLHTGQPLETTGDVVAAVRQRAAEDPGGFERLLDRMESCVRDFRQWLESESGVVDGAISSIRECEACLEAMGVVPAPVREAIREVEALGGAAKISGAGALSGDAAGCLLVCWPDTWDGRSLESLSAYNRQHVELGVPGLSCEVDG
jgi:mevalonate kinase